MSNNKQKTTSLNKRAVSLFSNCGAGDLGYRKAGFKFEVMAELEEKRLNVCLLNHPEAVGVKGDLRDTWEEVVEIYQSKTKNAPLSLLAACPPCQGMSSARGLRGLHSDADAGSKDERNLLAVIISKVALKLQPQMIVVENVPEFLAKKVRHPVSFEPVTASNLLIDLLMDDYKVFPILLDMCDFGVPQSRKRTFLTFIKRDSEELRILLKTGTAPYPQAYKKKPISVEEALRKKGFPELDSISEEKSKSDFGNGLHSVFVLPKEKYEMVDAIPKYSGKSAWENNTCKFCGNTDGNQNRPNCSVCLHPLQKPILLDKDENIRLIKGFKTSYKRMAANKPASTILTTSGAIGGHNTIHPFENRVLSTLECAYLQTFDDDFNWGNSLIEYGITNIRAMIGEAVPPHFTYLHGKILLDLLKNGDKTDRISVNDERCKIALKRLKKNRS